MSRPFSRTITRIALSVMITLSIIFGSTSTQTSSPETVPALDWELLNTYPHDELEQDHHPTEHDPEQNRNP